ncbi:hypothetical protein ACI2I2_08395 [Scandinavium sp. NPDC088450]|uniref:hypothetical protein n=1 Tax=Scandinavium sp. NPDC088450 TaxID=3364514 RepID=UPI00384D9F29
MLKFIKWAFGSLGRSMIWMYGPTILTIIFAMLQAWLFPGSPVWPIGVFFLFALFIITRYSK